MSDAQILLQAGHQNGWRNDGSGRAPTYGAGGIARPEREMTPIVVGAAAQKLRDAGYSVITEDAYFDKVYEVELAVAIHFDGSGTPCASGASIGYPTGSPPGSNRPAADVWRDLYSEFWPFKWMNDNFTKNLEFYYGYSRTWTSTAELLIEWGEISCPDQDDWLQPRVGTGPGDSWCGDLLAHYAARVIDGDDARVPKPAPYGQEPEGPEPPTLEQLLARVELAHANEGRRLARKARRRR